MLLIKNLFIYLFLLFIASSFVAAEDELANIETIQKHELFYKDGRSGGALEKTLLTQELAGKIFSIDLRNEPDFLTAINNSILFYQLLADDNAAFNYGEDEYTSYEMINSLNLFKKMMKKNQSYEDFLTDLASKFNVYTAKNNDDKAILTGYYTPHIEATEKKSNLFTVPVIIKNGTSKKPFFFVKNKIDIYNLKLEGAGVMLLPNGTKVTIEYAGKSKYKIVKTFAKMKTNKKIKLASSKKGTKVASRPKDTVLTVPYFKLTEGGPYGWADLPLTPRYTAAIDIHLAPMGGLIYVKSSNMIGDSVSVTNSNTKDFSNFEGFMLAQDIGAAIKGSGRVDVYCGEGQEGRSGSNSIKRVGSVFLLVAKKEILDKEFEGSIISKYE
jgi:membrane-bound lytic murein transglycosylase A